MRVARAVLLCGATLAAYSYSGVVAAQQSFASITCRGGTVSGLAKTEDAVVYSLDHRGVTLAEDTAKTFNNYTQRCIGSVAVIRGKVTGGGFCRNVDPKDGDATIIEWTASEKPGIGTFKFISGTGKWKGVTGGGAYQQTAVTRAVDDGTYQNCVRVKGTFAVP